MKRSTALIIVAGVLVLLLAGVALAAGLDFGIDWWTADGGGGRHAGGGYTLQGTIGQPDAWEAAGGGYTLSGGYWGGPFTEPETQVRPRNYLPMIIS